MSYAQPSPPTIQTLRRTRCSGEGPQGRGPPIVHPRELGIERRDAPPLRVHVVLSELARVEDLR